MFPEAVALPDPLHPTQPPTWRSERVKVLEFMLHPDSCPGEAFVEEIPYHLRIELQFLYAAAQYYVRCLQPHTGVDINFRAPHIDALCRVFENVAAYFSRCTPAAEAQVRKEAFDRIYAYAPWASMTSCLIKPMTHALWRAVAYLQEFKAIQMQFLRACEPPRMLAVAMARHGRIGGDSPLHALPPDVLQRTAMASRFSVAAALPHVQTFLTSS